MLRSTVLGRRLYSSQPAYTSAEIQKLLDRVKQITSNDNSNNNDGKRDQKKVNDKKAYSNFRNNKRSFQQQQDPNQQQQHSQSTAPRKPFQQRSARAVNSVVSDFSDVSSSFTTGFNTNVRKTNNQNDQNRQRRPMLTNKLRDVTTSPGSSSSSSSNGYASQTNRPRFQRRQNNGNKGNTTPRSNDRRGGRDSQILNKVNPNFEMITTVCSPEVPTLDSLIQDSPLTSQSPESRILKAFRELKLDEGADVSGVLTGRFHVTSDASFVDKLATKALKHNADVVVSSLNKNGSLDYETKMRLLLPLSGLAPVKQLSG